MHGPRRDSTSLRGNYAGMVSLGNEPALTVGDRLDNKPVTRAVSLRWLAGTVLTGFTSIFLMGGALTAALDGRHQLAVPPQAMSEAERAALDLELALERKGDRVRQDQVEEVSTREIMQVSTLTRQGDRDLIKLRPFAHVTASLATHKDELSGDIPEFDPIKIFNAGTIDSAPPDGAVSDQIYTADVDGEIAVKTVPFPLDFARMDRTPSYSVAEVEEMVRFDAGMIDAEASRLAAIGDAELEGYRVDGSADGAGAIGVRIIPENVTFVSRSDPSGSVASFQEKIATVKAKDTLPKLLERYKVGEDDQSDILTAMTPLIDLQSLQEGQKIRMAFAPFDADGGTLRPVRISVYADGVHQATVARTDDNGFVRADEPAALPDVAVAEAEIEDLDSGSVPRIYEAVYQTALNQKVPGPMINELIKVLSYEVDFQARVNYGDAIELLHSLPDGPAALAGDETGEILYASVTLGGTEKRFYRYRTPDDGLVDYYDAEGRSAKKFLMRKPMSTGVFRSGFGMRRHPILGRTRLHTGADWAAPRGTPIMAAGDGVIEKASRTSGYGNFTLIQHTNGYETAYGHQTRFAPGVVPGARVRQGQIIGYVGSTGLSTGPHLHYEVRINGKFVDPLRIRLPRGRTLSDDILASFERERQRIDELLGNEPAKQQFAAAD